MKITVIFLHYLAEKTMNLKNLKPKDIIVMPRFGVGQCRGWHTMEIDGCQHEVLSIYFYTQKFNLHLPKAKLAACSARALASSGEVAEAFTILKNKKSSNPRNWKNFVIDCHRRINSGEFKKLAQVVKDTLPNVTKIIGANKFKTDLHKTATALLASELMVIQNITHSQALEKLKQAINPSVSTQK